MYFDCFISAPFLLKTSSLSEWSFLEFIRRRACVDDLKLSFIKIDRNFRSFWKSSLSFTPSIMQYLISNIYFFQFLFLFLLHIAGWGKKYSWNHKKLRLYNHQACIVNKMRLFNSNHYKTKFIGKVPESFSNDISRHLAHARRLQFKHY